MRGSKPRDPCSSQGGPACGESRPERSEGRYDRDMRSRVSLFAVLLFVSSLALPLIAHAGIPFFGPIIPPQSVTGIPGSEVCAAGWGMLIRVINNIISLLITIAIVFVAPLMIAYAGFLFVVNPVNPSGKEKAKGVLLNTVVGIVIALAGYLIVAALMAVLYDRDSFGTTWSQLITSGDLNRTTCIPLAESLSQATQQNTVGVSTGALNAVSSGALAGSACDPAAVQAAAATGWSQYPLSNTQANTFACIARPESSCGRSLINYRWGNGSSAVGAFQVLLQTNSTCYDNPACAAAINLPMRSRLNCSSGFSGGNPIPGSAVADRCVRAASNLNCSASAAACLLQRNGGSFSPWQQDVNNAVQSGCINNGVL